MSNKLMSGLWRFMLMVPPALWEKQIEKVRRRVESVLAFATPEHTLVHHYVVRELPRLGRPMSPELTAEGVGLDVERVIAILADLEKHMTFLVTNSDGAVIWAYPVTVEPTPHRITFDSGETLYAAWAADAVATPFVQGFLRNESLSVTVDTECAHCSESMRIILDEKLNSRIEPEDCSPVVFVPNLNPHELEAPNIIDDFWKNSVFFRSEGHAREYRRSTHIMRGGYFTLEQFKGVTKIIQSALFQQPY